MQMDANSTGPFLVERREVRVDRVVRAVFDD
jgi:hypothetical protein